MNNPVLQRLIHGYQLINLDDSIFEKKFSDRTKPFISDKDDMLGAEEGEVNFNNFAYGRQDYHNPNFSKGFSKKWAETFSVPPHVAKGMKDRQLNSSTIQSAEYYRQDTKEFIPAAEMTEEERSRAVNFSMPPAMVKHMSRDLSRRITQAGKFYMKIMPEEELTTKEMKDCMEDIRIFCPYPETFLQYETDAFVFNLLAKEVETESADKEVKEVGGFMNRFFGGNKVAAVNDEPMNTIIDFQLTVWSKEQKAFQLDFSKYRVTFVKDPSAPNGMNYASEKLSDGWANFVDNDHPLAETWRGSCVSVWLSFMVFLQYPAIAEPTEKKGRANAWFDIPMKKHNHSEYRNKPAFQHTELVIKMFEESQGNAVSNGSSEGKAFHSVRKHLRTYQTGKKTWVRAHFRGSKEIGVVTKDYKVQT